MESMNAEEFRNTIAALGMSQWAAARFLGVSLRTSNGYANGRSIRAGDAKLLRYVLKAGISAQRVDEVIGAADANQTEV
jgi:hypothetical protein